MTTEKQKARSRAYYHANKEKVLARTKAYYHANRDKINERARWYSLKYEWGMTREEYTKILESQNSCCAICETTGDEYMIKYKRRFAIDHDHTSGKNRGLLCHLCNTGIGSLGDSIPTLKKSIKYLEYHGN